MVTLALRLLAVSFLALSPVTAQIPDALERALANRTGFKTAHWRYKVSTRGVTRDWHEERSVADFTVNELRVTVFGDEDGIMNTDREGRPALGHRFACAPRSELLDVRNNKCWRYREGAASAGELESAASMTIDVRTVGLEPHFYPNTSVERIRLRWISHFPQQNQWKVEDKGEIEVVTATLEDEGTCERWRWHLDPSQGGNIVKLTIDTSKSDSTWTRWGEAFTQYVFVDSHWIPRRFEGWRMGRGDRKLVARYELYDVSLDRPEHPRRIGVESLGIPAGAWIGRGTGQPILVWNGEKAIPFDQWKEIKHATNNRELRDLMARNQKADDYRYPAWWYDPSGNEGIEDLPARPDEWEVYVRRWCTRYDVDDKQRTAARGVLDDCRKEARAVLDKRRPDLEKVDAQLKDAKLTPAKRDAAIAERERLLRPVADVFTRLKARLEPLLRQEQITARAAATQPAVPRRRG